MTPLLTAVSAINEGLAVVNALMPMVQRELNGGAPVTPEEVSAALVSMSASLDALDEEIKKQGG